MIHTILDIVWLVIQIIAALAVLAIVAVFVFMYWTIKFGLAISGKQKITLTLLGRELIPWHDRKSGKYGDEHRITLILLLASVKEHTGLKIGLSGGIMVDFMILFYLIGSVLWDCYGGTSL